MSATMTCKKCGATMTGSVAEVLNWHVSHNEYCSGISTHQEAQK